MSLFKPNWTTPEHWCDMIRNSKHREPQENRDDCEKSVVQSNLQIQRRCPYVSTWLLPSFINHSCMPNVHRTVLPGTTVSFFVAIRDIAAGEEIGLSYINGGHPYRRKRLRGMNMKCDCRICFLEEVLETELAEVASCCRDLTEAGYRFAIAGGTDVPAMLLKLESVLMNKLQFLRAVYW